MSVAGFSVSVMDAGHSDAELLDEMVELQRSIARSEAELATKIQTFVASRRTEPLGGEWATDEVAAALRWARGRVLDRVHVVRVLRTELPATWAAWRSGTIDGFQAAKILEARNRLIDDHLVAGFDADAAAAASTRSAGQLIWWLNRRVAAAEPAQLEARYRRAFADRRVATSQDLDGMGALWATTSAVDLTAIDYRLTQLAQGCGAEDPRSLEQRRADIFVDLLLGAATDHAGPSKAAVAVTVPVQSLLGLDDTPGQICGGGPVPASVVRELADRPGTLFYRLLTDQPGSLLDVAQLGRFPTPLLGFAVDLRDQTCRFPGCLRPATGCDRDHTIRHPDGTTSYENLGCLCRRHHRCKPTPGYTLRQPEPGVFEWLMPTGHRYTVSPEPLPLGHWPDEPPDQPHPPEDDAVTPADETEPPE